MNQRPNPMDYRMGDCDGYDGGCHVCASGYLEGLQAYRAECVICVVDNVDAYNAANEIQWADSEIAEATKTAVTVGTIYERPKYDPVVTRVDHEDGSITLTERWSSMWTLRSEAI